MLVPRVTMQDVARAADVHQTTVSLALRNDPRLPEKTRLRVRKIAEQIGYRPDPMLSALNFYRSGRRATVAPTTIGFLLNFRDRDELAESHPHRLFLEGARTQAERMGFSLEAFYVGHSGSGAGSRMERVLRTRGIVGAIIAAFGDKMIKFEMSWERFSVVMIESQQLGHSLHMISSDQMMITREAIQRLHDLGYRRIGLAVGEREEAYLHNAYTAGYFAEIALHPGLVRLPPLLLDPALSTRTQQMAPVVASWTNEHAVEVVLSNWAEIPDALRLMGRRVPRDVVVASLDLNPHVGSNAGMEQHHRLVGARAVEQLAILLKTNQRGAVELPNRTLIGGRWVDGADVPRRVGRGPVR